MFDSSLIYALVAIVLHVANYNATAQFEYKTRTFTKLLGKHTIYYNVVYLISSALVRDHFVNEAMQSDVDSLILFPQEFAEMIGNALFVFGILLNLWTLHALGLKGMYNGDSFGWIMDAPVTGGPYQFFNDPQYVGTIFVCLGPAIIYQTLSGYICTLAIGITFYISVKYVEGPHLTRIYSNKAYSKINFKK
ncbi:phospholipid methyltransferase family protein [Tieghemostelium lacteum]|uniref:Phosphatidylethanolamine N-methyltransferase n=1 Tax=Tieghemostelium lacteum TaxID=361077 RepID=A0A151ZC83_TIELA|nr:phospholipid methyltransferase family protein [Tieghemostelium lacteum]|eukprot:KYQ91556.1 phospholipid methyltransferase family protein [Tieghemostelium lacteum]